MSKALKGYFNARRKNTKTRRSWFMFTGKKLRNARLS
jgi:hypothetical protein